MLKKNNGNILFSVTIAVMAAVSGLVFSSIAHRDTIFTNYQLDMAQQLHLVRSDIKRGAITTEYLPSTTDQLLLPLRKLEINNGLTKSTHIVKTGISRSVHSVSLQHTNRRAIMTKTKTFRRRASEANYYGTRDKSPVECAASRVYATETLAGYMYFTDIDKSIFDTEVWFYGEDVLWGKVHSNTSIHCKFTSQSWPIFHGMVTSPEPFSFHPTTPDYEELFLGGWDEEAPEVVFSPTASLIRANGQHMPVDWANTDILYVEINRDMITYYTGQIMDAPYPTQFTVYDSYPPYGTVGEAINTSVASLRDTVWTGPNYWSMNDGSVMTYATLWIRGEIQGAQTWGCSEDIYIMGDLTYSNTTPGMSPDGTYSGFVNMTDYLGLVSEHSIYINYGYTHPGTRDRLLPNCGTLDGSEYPGIYIYAALCAMGDGGGVMVEDGIFTFEYQFPYTSTPDQAGYSYIDMHLCRYPSQTPNRWPWPANSSEGIGFPDYYPDYPWYNPLWPKWVNYRERGNIFLWGSVAQRRRGFVHRSGNQDHDTGYWDIEDFKFGPIAPNDGNRILNAPGATGNGIGYDKDYRYDNRLIETPPPDYPEVHLEGGQSQIQEVAFFFIPPPSNF